ALVEAEGVTDAERARALSNFAFASTLVGETSAALALLDRAGSFAESAGDPDLQMRVLYHRGIAAIQAGRPADALAPLHLGRDVAVSLDRERAMSAFDDTIGTVRLHAGDAATAAR